MIRSRFAFALFLTSFATGALAAEADEPPQDPPLPPQPQALWSTPGDGTLIALVRNAKDFQTAIPVRVRVCVTNFTGDSNAINLFVWTTAGPQPTPATAAQPQVLHPKLGECVEIDRPAAVVVQDSTVNGSASGYYQLLQPTSLPFVKNPKEREPRHKPEKERGYDIKVSTARLQEANCSPLGPVTADFASACEVVVPGSVNGVRICTSSEYVTAKGDRYRNYAASLLDLTTSDLRQENKKSPYDYRWSPITGASCRDVIYLDVVATERRLFFMVGPSSTRGYWDPAIVEKINFRVQNITWKKDMQ